MTGWIKIYRSLQQWPFYKDKDLCHLWLTLLLSAEHEDTVRDGVTVERGSLYTSLFSLAKEENLSMRQVRTCLKKLVSDKQVTCETTNKGTKITICNFESYQDERQAKRQAKRQANDTQTAPPLFPPDSFPSTITPSLSPLISPQVSKKKEEKEGDTGVSPKKTAPSFDDVMKLWNSTMRRVPKVRSLTPARKEKVKLRVNEMGGWDVAMTLLQVCFKKIEASDFCNGSTGKWVANFDWFFENEKNWLKVYEGNYDNRREKSDLEKLHDAITIADAYYEQRYRASDSDGNTTGGWDDSPDEQ